MNDEHAQSLIAVGMAAQQYFQDKTLAMEWLEKAVPHHFGGASPLAYARRGVREAAAVALMLERLEHGVYI